MEGQSNSSPFLAKYEGKRHSLLVFQGF